MRRLLLAVGLLLTAPATAGAAERAVGWTMFEGPPRQYAKAVQVMVYVDDCGDNADQQRVEMDRTAEAITITVFDAIPEADLCPAIAKQVFLPVDLGGRLGRRAIIDGADGRTVVSEESAVPWRFEDTTFNAAQRTVRISFPRLCGPSRGYTRFVARRTRRKVVLTVLQRRRDPPEYPASCGRATVKAPLGGRLGRRVVRDGSSSPPTRKAATAAAERAVAWTPTLDEYVPRHDDDVIGVTVYVDACGKNQEDQRAEVKRTAGAVTITVFDADPDPPADVCPEIAKRVDLDVELPGPLGRRAVIDGSDGRTVFTRELPLRWEPANKALPQPSARRLNISYRRCAGETTRPVVRRTKAAVTITVLRRTRTGAGKCDTRVTQDVRLGGRLGRRAVRDGGSSPPRIVFAGP